MIKALLLMIAGAVILFFVFAIIGAYREVVANAKEIKQLKEKCCYEYERGYGDGFTAADKDKNVLNE